MTDYNELVNQLREYLTTRQISELLEAQAKEIAEKDARISSWEQDNEVLGQLLSAKVKQNEKLRARIAELEAKNGVLRDAVQKFVDYDSTYHKDKEKMMLDYEVAIAAARAALNGEK